MAAMEKAKITLGADPEFELVRRGRPVSVADLLEGERELPWGLIGKEREQLELRPWPSRKPETLVRKVGKLLLMVPRVLGGVPSTACEAFAIGGHVHIGGVPEGAREDVARAVDEALGDLFHHLNTETRLRAGYGRRGDWRPQPWGVEYRTPPANIWSHPGVALAFLRAIKWVAEKFLLGEDLFEDPAWPLVRAEAEKAAEFVRTHGGRLHWGAWREHIGKFDLREGLKVEVALEPGMECDEALEGDLRAMCARLGIPWARIYPLERGQGEYASDVPGYGEVAVEVEPYKPGGTLALSWRFRNDSLFRREELPKLEEALAQLLEGLEGEDGGEFLVREAVPFSAEWPLEAEDEEEEEDWEPDRRECVCDGCGVRVSYWEMRRGEGGGAYCRDCWEEENASCRVCGRQLRRDNALYDRNRRAYCEECYQGLYVVCSACEEEVSVDEARWDEVGEAFCESCYAERYTSCLECGQEVSWDEVEEHDGLHYCPSCFPLLFDSSEEETVLGE